MSLKEIVFLLTLLFITIAVCILYNNLCARGNTNNKKIKKKIMDGDYCAFCGLDLISSGYRYYYEEHKTYHLCNLCFIMLKPDVPIDSFIDLYTNRYPNRFGFARIKQYGSSSLTIEQNKNYSQMLFHVESMFYNFKSYIESQKANSYSFAANKIELCNKRFNADVASGKFIETKLIKQCGDRCCNCGNKSSPLLFYKNEEGENKSYCKSCVISQAVHGRTFKHIDDPRLWVYKDLFNEIYEEYLNTLRY